MDSIREFPSDRPGRTEAPERQAAIAALKAGIERCRDQLSPFERDSPYFLRLTQRLSEAEDHGVSSFGRLLGASRNWLEHYRAYRPGSFSPALNESQLRLSTLCQQLTFQLPRLGTQSDLVAHRREMNAGALKILG